MAPTPDPLSLAEPARAGRRCTGRARPQHGCAMVWRLPQARPAPHATAGSSALRVHGGTPSAPFASCRHPAKARPSLSCLLLLLRVPLCSSSDLCCRLTDSFHLYKESQVLTLNLYSHLSIYYSLLHISIYLFASLHWEHLCNSDLQSCSSLSWQYMLVPH